ncbi:hypothetical protein [Nocardioides lijunqiniae]|uniref:hypothetical protein n=1 Tax=Nocardioides lijunqiniae TaxID=2760832 RepID=UPI001878439D|nr:hypothetical protein [Nocardioides lijunqiniae]
MTLEPDPGALEDHDDLGEPASDPASDPVPDEERVRTGEERVDSVVAAIEQLRDRPVDEHVAAFEQAHDELRRALDDVPPQDPA